jgi:hypothetical protein
MMSRLAWATVCCAAIASAASADQRDPLAEARLLYNQRNFEAAVNAAEKARLIPELADSADLIAARAYLERFRDSAASDDLTNARERLRRLNPHRIGPLERVEFIVGLGETLYFDESYGSAAAVFSSALGSTGGLTGEARERVLDWWATSTEQEARPRPEIDRQAAYERIRMQMQQELTTHPGIATASYWLAAAARGKGDLQAAWDAAVAGWVRAPLSADRGVALRADLDRLMQRAIIPERAKALAQPPENLRQEWERFKEKWKS